MGVLDEPHQHRSSEWPITGRDATAGVSGAVGTPGPGTYGLCAASFATGRDSPSFSMGGWGPRGDDMHSDGPGPGAYGACHAFDTGRDAPSYSMGTGAPRFGAHDDGVSGGPGPGSHHSELPRDMPAYSFGKEPAVRTSGAFGMSDTPGPGAYAEAHRPRGPAYSLGGGFDRRDGTDMDGPGVGTYDARSGLGSQFVSEKLSGPAYSIGGKRAEGVPMDDIPYYDVGGSCGRQAMSARGTGPSFSMASRAVAAPKMAHSNGRFYDQPGACGGQAASGKVSAASFSMGKSRGSGGAVGSLTFTPGPGASPHDDRVLSTKATPPAFSMGHASGRPSSAPSRAANGGRYYDTGGAFGQQQASGKATVAAFSMGKSSARGSNQKPTKTRATGPGPGDYELPGAFGGQHASRKRSVASFSFRGGRGGRPTRAAGSADTPGPGAYTQPSTFGSQAASGKMSYAAYKMGKGSARSATSRVPKESTPGPGAYDHTTRDPSKPTSPSCSIGTCSRATASAGGSGVHDTPAPGAYTISGGFGSQLTSGHHSGAAFSIGRAHKDEIICVSNDTPGPGAHETVSAFGKQMVGGRPSNAAVSFHGSGSRSPSVAVRQVPETYSDMTRFGSHPLASGSQRWARSLGRVASSERDIDFVHRY